MIALRSLIYAAIFYPATGVFILSWFFASLFGPAHTRAVVIGWAGFHHRLVGSILGIRVRLNGAIPPGPHLIAVKHQSVLETLEMFLITDLPVIVIKKELADIPGFGWMTRQYGIIAVERSAGAKALRNLVAEGKQAIATGRPIVIYPEGTRVPVGQAPPLKSGFAALYRTLGLPVVPVATDSGRLWGRGFLHRPGVVTIKILPVVPAGLKREQAEARVHAAINAFESAAQPRA